MLGLVVLLFAVLSLPYRGLMVYNWFATTPWLNIWYMLFARTCIFLNSSINPLLYDLMVRTSTKVYHCDVQFIEVPVRVLFRVLDSEEHSGVFFAGGDGQLEEAIPKAGFSCLVL